MLLWRSENRVGAGTGTGTGTRQRAVEWESGEYQRLDHVPFSNPETGHRPSSPTIKTHVRDSARHVNVGACPPRAGTLQESDSAPAAPV